MFICNLLLFPPLFFSSNHPKISFLPLCIYKNGQKNRAKTGRFSLQFLPSNHNILWLNPSISSLFHNTASESLTQRAPSTETYPPAGTPVPDTHASSDTSNLWQESPDYRKHTQCAGLRRRQCGRPHRCRSPSGEGQ